MIDAHEPAGLAPGEINLRQAQLRDEEFLFEVFLSTVAPAFAHLPLPEAQKTTFIKMQYSARAASWGERFPGIIWYLIYLGEKPTGAISLQRGSSETRFIDLALLPGFRAQGIGTAVLQRLLAEADAAGHRVHLSVEATNPAQRLYGRLGFVESGREGPYILMQRTPQLS